MSTRPSTSSPQIGDSSFLRTLTLPIERRSFESLVGDRELKLLGPSFRMEEFHDPRRQELVLRATQALVKGEETVQENTTEELMEPKVVNTIRFPDGWFQALKVALAPRWWLRRWPVRYVTQPVFLQQVTRKTIRMTTNRYCPHFHIPSQDREHMTFLLPSAHQGLR